MAVNAQLHVDLHSQSRLKKMDSRAEKVESASRYAPLISSTLLQLQRSPLENEFYN